MDNHITIINSNFCNYILIFFFVKVKLLRIIYNLGMHFILFQKNLYKLTKKYR